MLVYWREEGGLAMVVESTVRVAGKRRSRNTRADHLPWMLISPELEAVYVDERRKRWRHGRLLALTRDGR